MKKLSCIVCLVLCAALLFGCKSSIDSGWVDALGDGAFSCGAIGQGAYGTVNVQEKGVFYISGSGLLSYYDYESDDCYVLCSAPNCSHSSGECAASTGPYSTGFGLYGDCGYYLRRSEEYPNSQWEFVRVDIGAQTAEVLCLLGSDGTVADQWWCIGVEQVYYHRGYAWMTLSMQNNAVADDRGDGGGRQMLAIELETGEITEITPPMIHNLDYSYVRWSFFSDASVFYDFLYYQTPFLSFKEYQSIYTDVTEAEYMEYGETYFNNEPRFLRHIEIDHDTMEQTVFRDVPDLSSERVAWLEEDGPVYWMPERLEDGSRITRFVSVEADGSMMEHGSLEGGYLFNWYLGDFLFAQYDNNSYLYVVDAEPSARQMWRYRIDSGESTYLFDFTNDTLFNLFGQTSDKLVGMLNGNTQYAWIYKSDYEKGNFDALHRFSLS